MRFAFFAKCGPFLRHLGSTGLNLFEVCPARPAAKHSQKPLWMSVFVVLMRTKINISRKSSLLLVRVCPNFCLFCGLPATKKSKIGANAPSKGFLPLSWPVVVVFGRTWQKRSLADLVEIFFQKSVKPAILVDGRPPSALVLKSSAEEHPN